MIGESDYAPELDGTAKEHFETMTTPDPDILYRALAEMADAGVEVVVMEASSHALALEKLAPDPDLKWVFLQICPANIWISIKPWKII